eukprot:131826-Prymnesium_polylepis.1
MRTRSPDWYSTCKAVQRCSVNTTRGRGQDEAPSERQEKRGAGWGSLAGPRDPRGGWVRGLGPRGTDRQIPTRGGGLSLSTRDR